MHSFIEKIISLMHRARTSMHQLSFIEANELSQSRARISLSALISLCGFVSYFIWDDFYQLFIGITLASYATISVFIHGHILLCPQPLSWRKYLTIVTDIFCTGFVFSYIGAPGAVAFPIFLWVVVGNGYRHGLHYFTTALILGLIAISIAPFVSPYWMNHVGIVFGFCVGLLVLSLFYYGMVSKVKEANKVLEKQVRISEYRASRDSLTDLGNRTSLLDFLNHQIARIRRDFSQEGLAILYIDLNDFKPINDTYGHHVGDKILKKVANRIKSRLRKSDFAARIGGDEFVVALTNVKDNKGVLKIANDLNHNLRQEYIVDKRSIPCFPSVGVAIFNKQIDNAEHLMRLADKAMYEAKSNHSKDVVLSNSLKAQEA